MISLNFNCIFTSCGFKRNNVDEQEFLNHLSAEHCDELLEISKKENISIKMAEMSRDKLYCVYHFWIIGNKIRLTSNYLPVTYVTYNIDEAITEIPIIIASSFVENTLVLILTNSL